MKRVLTAILAASLLLTLGCAGNEAGTSDTTLPTDTTEAPVIDVPEEKFEMREDQVYAADLLETADTLSIAILGGSITSGTVTYPEKLPWWPTCGNQWSNSVISYFVTKYRNIKTIKAENIALPGTQSLYGATRFATQLEGFNPDIVLLEYSMNDMGMGETESTLFYEHIIRQCMDYDKIPSIVFVHTANPHEETSSSMGQWKDQVARKDALAEYYGLKTVNVYDTILAEYEASGTELSVWEYIGPNGANYFPYLENTTIHDVHPTSAGQKVISDTVLNGYESDPEGFFNRPKFVEEPYTKDSAEYLNTYFTMTPCTDDSITFEGDWTLYTEENQFVTEDANIAFFPHAYDSHYKFPCCAEGITQTVAPDSSFTFTTSAKSIALVMVSSQYASSGSTVYEVNEDGSLGQEFGKIYNPSSSTGMNQISNFVDLPDDGKEHTIKVVVDNPTDTNYVYRFGYIIEQFNK